MRQTCDNNSRPARDQVRIVDTSTRRYSNIESTNYVSPKSGISTEAVLWALMLSLEYPQRVQAKRIYQKTYYSYVERQSFIDSVDWGESNMPTLFQLPMKRVTANETCWEVSRNLSFAVNVSLADSFFLVGKCFIGEKYELITGIPMI